ncbi:MAG: tetratricopeptide repeat-containing sensor histidine kinase [Balneolaceae bacterium]
MNNLSLLNIVCIIIAGLYTYQPEQLSGNREDFRQVTAPVAREPDSREDIDRLLDEIEERVSRGELEEAGELIDEAEKKSLAINYTTGLALAEFHKGDILIIRGQYAAAIDILSEAYDLYRESDSGVKLGNLLASAYGYMSDYENALRLYTSLLETVREKGDTGFQAGLEQNIAVVYDNLGDTGQAIEFYFNSLETAESLSDTTVMMIVLNNIGELYRHEEDYDRAGTFIKESLELSRLADSPADESRALLNLGNVSRELGRYDDAMNYYQQSLEIADKLGNIVRPVQILFNMGNIYLDREQYARAEEAFRESLELSRERNIEPGEYYNHIGLGNVSAVHDNHDEAISSYLQARDAAMNLGSSEMQTTALEKLWKTYEKAGRFTDAFHELRQYQQLTDSLHALEKDESLARFETLFNLRSQRRQNEMLEAELQAQKLAISIGLFSLLIIGISALALFKMYSRQVRIAGKLKLKNEELAKIYQQVREQKEELSELNTTKDKLFSILAHDLRKPIAQLQGLVFLMHEDVMDEVNPGEILRQVDRQMNNSIGTLKNYLSWAQSQLEGFAPDLKPVNAYEKLTGILALMEEEARNKNIRIHNRMPGNVVVMADEDMIQIIFQNLVSNALKFSHSGDDIVVNAKQVAGRWQLSVKDTGIGIPEEKRGQLFNAFKDSRRGTQDEPGTGLGLSICKEFSEKQDAEIWFESIPDSGTTFYLSFARAEEKAGTEAGSSAPA